MKASEQRPWLKHYDQNMINNELPRCTMYEQLKRNSQGHENINALNYYGTIVSYGKLIENIDKYADAFFAKGIRKGEYVTFLTVSIPEAIYSIYALNKIGAVCNFIDVRTDRDHIEEYIQKANSKKIIVLDLVFEKVRPLIDKLGLETVIVHSPADSLPALKKLAVKMKSRYSIPFDGTRVIKNKDYFSGNYEKTEQVQYEPDMPAVITRTGGTTGVSKGVVLTNDSMNAVSANFRDAKASEPGKSLLNFLPLGVSYGIACGVHMALTLTLENILIPKFKPEDFPDLVCDFRPNHIIGVPIFYEYMMHSKRMENFDLSFVDTMAAGGDSANKSFEANLREFTLERGVRYPLAQGYGMSETSSASAFGIRNIHKDGSAGIPCVHTLISVFEPGTTNELELGELGEICITGPNLMKEYLNEPEETANALWTHPDGRTWVHSGDIGYIDEDGFLFIRGRIKRSIVRFDGHKSYPVQLESIVSKHEGVKNCCVIPVQDLNHEQGELPLIAIERAEECDMEDKVLIKQIMKMCEEGIEERSQPACTIIVDAIPITKNGKKDFKKLIEQYGHYDYSKKQ